jgi:hypothetical protein
VLEIPPQTYHPNPPKTNKQTKKLCPRLSRAHETTSHFLLFPQSNIISSSVIIVETLNCNKREFELGLGGGRWRKKICLSIGSNKEKLKNTNTHLTHV